MSEGTKKESTTLNMEEFNPKKAELSTLAKKHEAISKVDIIDEDSYNNAHIAQIELRDMRNAIKEQ